jgi:hypothetical protein
VARRAPPKLCWLNPLSNHHKIPGDPVLIFASGEDVTAQRSSNDLVIPNSYIAPSWSWASTPCHVEQSFSARADNQNIAKILEIPTVITVNNNPYDQLRDGWMKLAGRLAMALWPLGGEITFFSAEKGDRVLKSSNPTTKPLPYSPNIIMSRYSEDIELGSVVYFFPLILTDKNEYTRGIILRQVRGISSKFTRCASFSWIRTSNKPSRFATCYDYFDTISESLGFESILDDKGSKHIR